MSNLKFALPHHRTETHFVFRIFVSISGPRFYVVPKSTFFHFQPHFRQN